MIEAVVFDFDGTLTELTLDFPALRKAVEAIAERYVSPAQIAALSGLYIIEMIYGVEAVLPEGGRAFREEAFARLREMEVAAAAGKDLYPYTRDVLRALRGAGIRTGIITRNCAAAVAQIFPDMAAYVDAVATRDDVREVKPRRGHLDAVLGMLRVDASRALLVGDHPIDILAGKASGASTAGVLTGRTARKDFEAAGADWVVGDVREVPGIVAMRRARPSS